MTHFLTLFRVARLFSLPSPGARSHYLVQWGSTMEFWQILLLPAYCIALGSLMVFSFHRFWLVHVYHRYSHNFPVEPVVDQDGLRHVTVQLPVFNERYVVERLITAAAELDYPAHRLEIQVLDDSTDETTGVARRCVAEAKSRGVDIKLIHRLSRDGYKAGALAEGMAQAKGDFIAIFDADFIPRADFLRRTAPFLMDRPEIGMVQMRWAHLNRDYSLITKVQSIFLDGHFVMEHGARSRAGMFFNFNGTAGVWRKCCIEEAGGWQGDTLTEDLDLSYRAQLAGWEFVYLNDQTAPAEIPVSINGWKGQQSRWAKGSVQTAKKLLPTVLQADLPCRVKAEAVLHLCANTSYLMLAVLALLIFPVVLARKDIGWYRVLLVDLPLFASATVVVSRFYILSQKAIYEDWLTRLKYIPWCLALGMGLSFNNGRAVLSGLLGRKTPFNRTPKYNVVRKEDRWFGKAYEVKKDFLSYAECIAGLYFMAVVLYCACHAIYFPIPFLLLFAAGFLYVGALSVLQGTRRSNRHQTEGHLEAAAAD